MYKDVTVRIISVLGREHLAVGVIRLEKGSMRWFRKVRSLKAASRAATMRVVEELTLRIRGEDRSQRWCGRRDRGMLG